tara:strand:- start:6925 stop:7611 length:687 start_codon:yes stop_codon:yes gene_type:complete
MALILSLETATKVCSVALHQDGNLLAIKEVNGDYSHSENLTLFIQGALSEADKKLDDLDAVAISKGPGSYTGLRIGVSSAKGLCYALDIPLIAIETLQSMSTTAKLQSGLLDVIYLPMIDARRMEVFCAAYDSNMNLIRKTAAEIIDENSFEDLKNHQVYYFGDGAEKCQETLSVKDNFHLLHDIFPSANALGLLADARFKASKFEDVAYFEPYYLKDFVATKPRKLL